MAFSFGFSGDDIEEDLDDVSNVVDNAGSAQESTSGGPPPMEARTHDLEELLKTLPSKISYTTLTFTSPKGHAAHLPRRELFDIRLQLMAEDDDSNPNPLVGLDDADIKTNVYEGGFKSWECSLDLVKFLMDRGPRKDLDDLCRVHHVIELGCGTALPSLLLFQYALKHGLAIYFTLADYNFDVLRLVTLPNLLLTYASTLEPSPLIEESGDLDLSPEFLSSFTQTLKTQGLNLILLSGSWTPVPRLLDLIPSAPEMNTLVLGSETIYSPAALDAFTRALGGLLKRVKSGKAIVAAKRVYFGVGGSVDGFREAVSEEGLVGYEVEFEGLEEGGVRRCLVEVQML